MYTTLLTTPTLLEIFMNTNTGLGGWRGGVRTAGLWDDHPGSYNTGVCACTAFVLFLSLLCAVWRSLCAHWLTRHRCLTMEDILDVPFSAKNISFNI